MQNAECTMQNDTFLNAGEDLPNEPAEEVGETDAESCTPEVSQMTDGGKGHLTGSVPRAASIPRGALSRAQMNEYRALFGGLDDAEIHRLYKKVTKQN